MGMVSMNHLATLMMYSRSMLLLYRVDISGCKDNEAGDKMNNYPVCFAIYLFDVYRFSLCIKVLCDFFNFLKPTG